jgi:multidrug transporter EmrE-like cation transporter
MGAQTNAAINPFTWLFLAIVLRAVNQILMKLAALEWTAMESAALKWTSSLAFWTTVGLGMGIVSVLVARAYAWQKALEALPLAVAYPFFALTLITLMTSGYLIFGEPITPQNLAGAGLVCIGIWVIAGSHRRDSRR